MNKELEALLISAAKALDYGVVGVNPKRAAEFGVPVGHFVREGTTIPGHSKKAKTTGYYCPYSAWRPKHGQCLTLDMNSPGDGWTRYSLAVLTEDSTGHYSFAGNHGARTLGEMKAYLRALADGAYEKSKHSLPRRRRQ